MKLNNNLANFKNRQILLQCRTKDVIPNHIQHNAKSIYTLEIDNHPFRKEATQFSKIDIKFGDQNYYLKDKANKKRVT